MPHEDGELIRIAWHLGNRHLPVQLLNDPDQDPTRIMSLAIWSSGPRDMWT